MHEHSIDGRYRDFQTFDPCPLKSDDKGRLPSGLPGSRKDRQTEIGHDKQPVTGIMPDR